MYTREILEPRNSPVENGRPVLGTWGRAFREVDLLKIRRPYQWPLPGWLRNCRIKEWEWFSVHDDQCCLAAFFANVRLFRAAQVSLLCKESGERFVFRKLLPGSGWRLPGSLYNASLDSRSGRFFFRIHSWLDAETIKLDIDCEATRHRPSFTAHLSYNMKKVEQSPMAVSLGFTGERSMYAFKTLSPVRGDMVLGGKRFSLHPAQCSGIFCDYKGFFPYRMHGVFCGAMGFTAEGARYGFHIAETQVRENRRNNENALWVNGRLTPLPPVRITMPEGIASDWVIQDIEGMVDLVFTPKEANRIGAGVLAASLDVEAPFGFFNGVLVDSRGEQIQVRNLWGTGEKIYLRV